MAIVIRMPEVLAGATEAALQTWLVKPGEEVTVGQPLVEIETDKAVVEYQAEEAGTLAGLLIEVGIQVPVGTPIAVLAESGESGEAALAAAALESDEPDSVVTPPTGASAAGSEASGASAPAGQSRLFMSPLVRRLAAQRGLDVSSVSGSGPGGRIVRRDLDLLSAPVPAAQIVAPVPAPGQNDGYTDTPHTGMRRAIARRLTESKSTVPHFYLTAECQVDRLLELRRAVNETAPRKISVNDFIIKTVAAAFGDVPAANVTWGVDAIRHFERVDISVAVSTEGGLLTPVLRSVDTMTLTTLSDSVRDLAERARTGRLRQHELEGGSFSVTNLGMYGVSEFSAIINPPQSGILAIGAARQQPVVIDGQLAVGTVMKVTLSADHRAIDGALAAEWLSAFVRRVENPLSILV